MSLGGPGETKKAICRSLTNVVKASPLKDSIDPKAFFMMINSNFAILFYGGRVDLSPLWDALAQQHPPELLFGTFLKFQEAIDALGLAVQQPPTVSNLSDDERAAHIVRFNGVEQNINWNESGSGITPLIGFEAIQEDGGAPAPLELSTGDLKPLIPDDLKRKVNQGVAAAIRATPIGQKIDSAQLVYWVDSNFDVLCDGIIFRVQPLHDALKELGEISDSDMYAAIVRLRAALDPLRLGVDEPELQLDAGLREAIEQRVREAEEQARLQTQSGSIQPVARPQVQDKPKDGEPQEPKEQKRDRFGYSKDNAEKQQKKASIARIALLGIVFLAILGYGWFTRPNKTLEAPEFAVPLNKAELKTHSFFGQLNEAKWATMQYADRAKAIKAFEAQLKERGLISGAQVRNAQGQLVIAGSGLRLNASAFVMKGDLPKDDPTVPKDEPPPAEKPKAPPQENVEKPK